MNICDVNQCTGCMECRNLCSQNAIDIGHNEHGFYVPVVDSTKCVWCGICRTHCPANRPIQQRMQPPKTYAAWSKDSELRHTSSSGGIFSLLAEEILKLGGVVFGVVFDPERQEICHVKAENSQALQAMRGSKYVQSNTGMVYRDASAALQAGRIVLFTGTPCQCAAMRYFVGKEDEHLYLLDLVCHGTPSPWVFDSYLAYLRRQHNHDKVTAVQFREKSIGWDIFQMQTTFASGAIAHGRRDDDPYLLSFLNNDCLNACCHQCRYANLNRQGDLTLGDFWGYRSEHRRYRNTDKGISMVLVNTPKGEALLERIQTNAVCFEKTLEEAVAGNIPLQMPTPYTSQSEEFWNVFLKNRKLEDCIPTFLQPVPVSKKHKLRLWIDNHFYLFPNLLKNCYERILKRRAEQVRHDS